MSEILGRVDFAAIRKFKDVPIPELGGSVRLQRLTVGDFDAVDGPLKEEKYKMARTLALAIVDSEGKRIYTTEEDFQNIMRMPFDIYQPLIEAANSLNGSSKEKAEDTEKKSEAEMKHDSVSV